MPGLEVKPMPHDAARLRRDAQVLRLREVLDHVGDARESAQRAVGVGEARIKDLEAQVEHLAARCVVDPAELTWLRERAEALARVEAGGWWRLRKRLLPVIRVGNWLLRRGSP